MYDNDESKYNPQDSPPSQNKQPSPEEPSMQGSSSRREQNYSRDAMDRADRMNPADRAAKQQAPRRSEGPPQPSQPVQPAQSPVDRDAAYRRPPEGAAPPQEAFVPELESGHTRRLATVSNERTAEIALAASEIEQRRTAESRDGRFGPAQPNVQQQDLIDQHRLSAKDRRSVKRAERELSRVKRLLRKRVSGKPRRPASSLGFWGGLGQAIFSLVKMFTVVLLIIMIFVGSLGIGVVFGYVSSTDPLPANVLVSGDETSFVYDNQGEALTKLTGAYTLLCGPYAAGGSSEFTG